MGPTDERAIAATTGSARGDRRRQRPPVGHRDRQPVAHRHRQVLAREPAAIRRRRRQPLGRGVIALVLVRRAVHRDQVVGDVVGELPAPFGRPGRRPEVPRRRQRVDVVDLDGPALGATEFEPRPGVRVGQRARQDDTVAGAGPERHVAQIAGEHVVAGVAPVAPAWSRMVVGPRLPEHAPLARSAPPLVPRHLRPVRHHRRPRQQLFELAAAGAARCRWCVRLDPVPTPRHGDRDRHHQPPERCAPSHADILTDRTDSVGAGARSVSVVEPCAEAASRPCRCISVPRTGTSICHGEIAVPESQPVAIAAASSRPSRSGSSECSSLEPDSAPS